MMVLHGLPQSRMKLLISHWISYIYNYYSYSWLVNKFILSPMLPFQYYILATSFGPLLLFSRFSRIQILKDGRVR